MKFIKDAILDAAHDTLIADGDEMYFCTADVDVAGVPNYSKITGASKLAGPITLDSGDYAKADGDVSGRKVTIAEQAGQSVTADGDGAHVCILKSTLSDDSAVQLVTSCVTQSVSNGSTITIPAFDYELRDPV